MEKGEYEMYEMCASSELNPRVVREWVHTNADFASYKAGPKRNLYTLKIIPKSNTAYLEFMPTPVDRKTLEVLFQVTRVIVVVRLPPDATSFQNGYPKTEELVCSAISEEIVRQQLVRIQGYIKVPVFLLRTQELTVHDV
jgi:hypothetical protein